MDSQNIIELCRDSNETDNQVKLDQWLVAQDSLLEYFEEIEEEGAFPDLYGKSVLVSESQFPNVFNIVNSLSALFQIDPPECFVYDSYQYVVDSEGISRPRLEISARLLEDFSDNELKHVLAKELYHIAAAHIPLEVLAEKTLDLFQSIPNLPGINIINQFGGSLAFEAASFHFRNIAFSWFKSVCFSADNFAIAYTGDIKSSIRATLMTVLNERGLVETIDIHSYINQIGKIEACLGPAATIEVINEVIPYAPHRVKNMLRFLTSENGIELYFKLN
jgi:hypothetical protein